MSQCLIREHQLVDTFCDGCTHGVTDKHGIPIRKSWRIAYAFSIVALRDKICDGNHMHGESRDQALKLAESYTFSMTDAIHREFAKYAASRKTQALTVIHSPACCCVTRSNPWPIADNSSSIGVAQGNLRSISNEMAAAGKSEVNLDDVQEPPLKEAALGSSHQCGLRAHGANAIVSGSIGHRRALGD